MNIKSLIAKITKEKPDEAKAFDILNDDIGQIRNRLDKLETKNLKYFVNAYAAANHVLANNVAIIFGGTTYPQFGNMHSSTINNTKFYIRRSNVYHICAGASFAGAQGGTYRQIGISLVRNGAAAINIAIGMSNYTAVGGLPTVATSYYLYEGDVLELVAFHNTGGNATVVLGPYTFMSITERLEDLDPDQMGLFPPITS